MIKWILRLIGIGSSSHKPKPRSTDPIPADVEWRTIKKSGIAHQFYFHPGLNPHYLMSICGFETTADKITNEPGRACIKCERAKP